MGQQILLINVSNTVPIYMIAQWLCILGDVLGRMITMGTRCGSAVVTRVPAIRPGMRDAQGNHFLGPWFGHAEPKGFSTYCTESHSAMNSDHDPRLEHESWTRQLQCLSSSEWGP